MERFFSAIGYFASRNNEHPLPKRINGFQLASMWMVIGALWVLPMATGAGLKTFISLPSFVLYLGFIFMAILMNTDNKKSLVHCVADAALAGIMVSLVAALVIWFQSSPEVQQQDSMRSEISMLTERLAKLEGS
jgi:hypothetical protein